MSPVQEHPSFLALDRAAGSPLPLAAQEHLSHCEACASHVARVQEPEPVPGWVRALEAPARRRGLGWFGWSGALFAVTLASFALLVWPHGEVTEQATPYVGVKGAPALALYVKRGEQVSVWDGTGPVRPGDRLRLQLASQEYAHVWVGTEDGRSQLVRLYSAPLPAGGELLPPSWSVDGEGRVERLLVVLSREPLGEARLRQAVEAQTRDTDIWVELLQLRKDVAP